MKQPKYKFYATLLDSFQYYKSSQSEDAFKEFIDKINRVPFVSEAAEKGTAFNECVDQVMGELSLPAEAGLIPCNGFWFDEVIVKQFTDRLQGATPQVRVSGTLQTDRGLVELYGFIDELLPLEVVDIKTTKQYTFPKYLHSWQKIVYPFCLNQLTNLDYLFTYLVTDFKEVYDESYQYNKERDVVALRNICEDLIDFLETYRHLITDKKVFAQEDDLQLTYDNDLNVLITS